MINSIRLINWRNFKDVSFNLNNELVIFLGNNAVGKTSILEAIYYISTTKSHRTNNILSVINNNSSFASIILTTEKSTYKAYLAKDSKYFFKGEVKVKPLDFAMELKSIIFSPDDLSLINGTKEDKRKFLDLNISYTNPKYLNILMLYKKVLKKRNEILKSPKVDLILLKTLTSNLTEFSQYINTVRINFINKLNNYLKNICKNLNFFNVYLKEDFSASDIINNYEKYLSKDLFYKTTTYGPHRDSFQIFLADKDAKIYASEGQKRLIVIAIKLAIYEIVKENSKPILLLDDVFCALDYQKQISLVKYLDNYQTLITTTSLVEIPRELLKKALIIKL